MKTTLTFLFIICSLVCQAQQKIKFQGIKADVPAGIHGLWNPERGLRLEVALDVAARNHAFHPDEYPGITTFLDEEMRKYASDSISLVQTYFYLTGYIGRNISEDGFNTMELFFNRLRSFGKKAVLRFAYEREFLGRALMGPTLEDIRRHAVQLKPFLEKNKDVIMVVQAGMIGAWGEWHSSFHHLEGSEKTKKEILKIICDMVPEDRQIQVRVPAYKNLISKDSSDYKRISFHDDFIVIKPHQWDGGMREGMPYYNQIVEESPFLLTDGELPWGSWSINQDKDNPEDCWLIDGLKIAERLFRQHYTSLSAIHNYKEGKADDKFSMQYWKETPVMESFLANKKMPYSPSYFRNSKNQRVSRNVFDYIRDHLGYRIELQMMTCKSDNDNMSIDISLINRGFSTIVNTRPVYLVLIDKDWNVSEVETSSDVTLWQPYMPTDTTCTPLVHHIHCTINKKQLKSGKYKLGLWLPDHAERLRYNPLYAVHCANDNTVMWKIIGHKYGINLLWEFELHSRVK